MSAVYVLPSAGQERLPEVVCDFTPIVAGPVEGDGPQRVDGGERIRLTFRDLDAKAGTGKVLFGDGASAQARSSWL